MKRHSIQDIFLIGGSPSSGSTLLVKLLNQYSNIIGLPETGLFSHGCNLLNVADEYVGESLNWYLPWLLTDVKVAHALGWKIDEYNELKKRYSTAFKMLRSRVDPDRKYWLIEKAPENIFAFDKYLADNKGNRVIVTSRDALSVVQSLMRRGFTLLEGTLAWFAHSYETAMLISNYPSQVYHCAYHQLAKSPDRVLTEIVQFLGIYDSLSGKSGIVGNTMIAGPEAHHHFNRKSVTVHPDTSQMFLDISNWSLTDSSWSKSPDEVVQYLEPVNLIGLEYKLLMDRLVFKISSNKLIRAVDVDRILCGNRRMPVNEVAADHEEIKAKFNSSYTRCLAKHYRPCLLRI